MAALEKHTASSIDNHLKHNTRGFSSAQSAPLNPNIYSNMTKKNYSFPLPQEGPNRIIPAKESKKYYNQRMTEIYHMNRADLVCAAEWCCTLPRELKESPFELQQAFFSETYNFLNSKYGEENCIQAIVHYDEGIRNTNGERILGSPHMHYIFIPVVPVTDTNPLHAQSKFEYKVCSKQLITKTHLKQFHADYQAWIDRSGIACKVSTGTTGGINLSVEELKTGNAELIREQKKNKLLQKENIMLQNQIVELKHQLVELTKAAHQEDHSIGWGSSTGWGNDKTWGNTKTWENEF